MGRGSEDSEPLTRNFHFQLACEKVTRFIIIIIIFLNLIEKVNSFFHLYIFGLEIEKKKRGHSTEFGSNIGSLVWARSGNLVTKLRRRPIWTF